MVRRKEGDRGISPVIDQPARGILLIELEHRQQLDRGDPQVFQVGDFIDYTQVGAAPLGRHTGVGVFGQPAYVHLVDNRVSERSLERAVAFPIVAGRVDDDVLHGEGSVIPSVARQLCGCTARGCPRSARTDRAAPSRHRSAARLPARRDRRRARHTAARFPRG